MEEKEEDFSKFLLSKEKKEEIKIMNKKMVMENREQNLSVNSSLLFIKKKLEVRI